jgi:uncharacterized protein YjbI with pentapeptide repeats
MANVEHCSLVQHGAEEWNQWYSARPHVMADFAGERFVLCSFAGMNLTGARFNDADLRYADLSRCDLRGAVFTRALTDRANLCGANLAHAVGLTQRQLDNMIGDAETAIPDDLQRPHSWIGVLDSSVGHQAA